MSEGNNNARRGRSSQTNHDRDHSPAEIETETNGRYSLPDEDDPLSLAEQLVEEAERGVAPGEADLQYEKIKHSDIHIAELQRMTMPQLIEAARHENLKEVTGIKKQDLIFKILKERVKLNGLMYGEGTLEILPDGFGFLRSPDYHYLSCPDDIYEIGRAHV